MKTRSKVGIAIAGAFASAALLVPATSHAATPTCIVIKGPSGLNIQIGYAPNGPASCRQL